MRARKLPVVLGAAVGAAAGLVLWWTFTLHSVVSAVELVVLFGLPYAALAGWLSTPDRSEPVLDEPVAADEPVEEPVDQPVFPTVLRPRPM